MMRYFTMVTLVLFFKIDSKAQTNNLLKKKEFYSSIDIFSLKGYGKGRKIRISNTNGEVTLIKHKAAIKPFKVERAIDSIGLLISSSFPLESNQVWRFDSSYHTEDRVVKISKKYLLKPNERKLVGGSILQLQKSGNEDVILTYCKLENPKEPFLKDLINHSVGSLGLDNSCKKILKGAGNNTYIYPKDQEKYPDILERIFFMNFYYGIMKCENL